MLTLMHSQATTSVALPTSIDNPLAPPHGRTCYRNFIIPTLADALFLIILLRLLQLGSAAFFNDPGTGWHIQTGDNIIDTHAVPTADAYSFTRHGQPWVQTQWLGDVLMALAGRTAGYPLIALLTAIILALLFRAVYRAHVSAGGWPTVALLITLLATGAASGHFLARPLIATTVGLPLCFWWATQYARGQISTRQAWLLVPIAALWANLHPGVLGGIATVGLTSVGLLISATFTRDHRRGAAKRALTLLAISLAMGAATLINPYGLGWHRWIAHLTTLTALPHYVDEWQPPVWTDPDCIAAGLLLTLATLTLLVRRRGINLSEALVLTFWLAQAAQHYRHLPVAALLVALQSARLLANVRIESSPLRTLAKRLPLFSADMRAAEQRTAGGLVSAAIVAVLIILVGTNVRIPVIDLAHAGPPADKYSAGALNHLRQHPPGGHLFHDMKYGGLIIRDVPATPVFIDDRFGLYGDAFIKQYIATMGDPDGHADDLFDRWQITAVLVDSNAPFCHWLSTQPDWTQTYRDRIATIYTRPEPATPTP